MLIPNHQDFMEWKNITTEEIMDKLDMFQARFGKVDEFGWWGSEWIQTYAGAQFTYKDIQEVLSVRAVWLALVAPDHQEINVQVEVTWWTLQTISHSIIVHTRVLDKYIHFNLYKRLIIYFPSYQMKRLINQDVEPTTPHNLASGTKSSVSNLWVLFFSCVLRIATARVDGNTLNMSHW